MIVLVCLTAFALVGAFFGWRWGQDYWYGRYPVEAGYDAYWDGDHGRAHPILRAHARNGDPRSQTYLAMQFGTGKGTFRSERQAFEERAESPYPGPLSWTRRPGYEPRRLPTQSSPAGRKLRPAAKKSTDHQTPIEAGGH